MNQRSGTADRLLYLASALGCGLVIAAPLARWLLPSAAPWLYAFFDLVCHQRPERSFHLAGEPLAVCHRCFGLYLGFPIGLLLLTRLSRLRGWLETSPRLVGWFWLPMLIDVAIRENTAWSRFGTGLLASFPVGLLASIALGQVLERRHHRRRHHRGSHDHTVLHPQSLSTQTTET